MKHYHRLSSNTTGEHGQVTLRDLANLAKTARRLGCPLDDSNIAIEGRDTLIRFQTPAVEWSEEAS